MRFTRLSVLLVVSAALLSWPGITFADTVSIGIGTVPVTVASGTGTASFNGASGAFSTIHVTGTGQSLLASPDLLLSDTIDTLTTGSGSITIWISDQGLTNPTGTLAFTSGFTANLVPAGWQIDEATFISPTNALFSGNPLSSAAFTAAGATNATVSASTGGGPYSVSEEYVITAPGTGDANNTIDLSARPVSTYEPDTMIGLGMGLLSLGGLLKRRYARFG